MAGSGPHGYKGYARVMQGLFVLVNYAQGPSARHACAGRSFRSWAAAPVTALPRGRHNGATSPTWPTVPPTMWRAARRVAPLRSTATPPTPEHGIDASAAPVGPGLHRPGYHPCSLGWLNAGGPVSALEAALPACLARSRQLGRAHAAARGPSTASTRPMAWTATHAS